MDPRVANRTTGTISSRPSLMSTPARPSTASLGMGGTTVSSRMAKPTPTAPSRSTTSSRKPVMPPWSEEAAAARRDMRPTVTARSGRHLAAAGVGSPPMRQRFTAGAVVVGDRAGTVVPDAAVDVEDGTLTWVGPAADAPDAEDAEVVAVPGLLLPGLVNAHSHAPMVLFREIGRAHV